MNQDIGTDSYTWLKRENANDEVNIEPELIEVKPLEDMCDMYYPPIPLYKRMIDFVKSWFYYPKLKKYAMEHGGLMKVYISNTGRFQYSWWHCRKGIYNVWKGR